MLVSAGGGGEAAAVVAVVAVALVAAAVAGMIAAFAAGYGPGCTMYNCHHAYINYHFTSDQRNAILAEFLETLPLIFAPRHRCPWIALLLHGPVGAGHVAKKEPGML